MEEEYAEVLQEYNLDREAFLILTFSHLQLFIIYRWY